jgi:hypothetical protein
MQKFLPTGPITQLVRRITPRPPDVSSSSTASSPLALCGNCQERCHLLEAFYAFLAKVTWRLVCWVANGSLIHTKSGCFQQRIDLHQRFEFAMRANS